MYQTPETEKPVSSFRGDRYRAKVAFVSPVARRNSFEDETECFLGVSLQNRNFMPNRFHALTEWAARRFPRCRVLIGDRIHRITLETTLGMPPAVALTEATRLGQDFMDEHRALLDSYADRTVFDYVTCGEIQDSEVFRRHFGAIRDYFDRVPAFRASVETFGRNYHRHDWEQLTADERAWRLECSSRYFLEEFAVFATLVGQGTRVMVYPGSFSTLAEIADGAFPGILPELEQLTVVSIQLKRR